MKDPFVSIIIVNWNGGKVFSNCLDSVARLEYSSWELIVVDNGSSDSDFTIIKNSSIPKGKIKIIKNKSNVGFATANNQGFSESKGEYILLLNNDTKVSKDLLERLIERMKGDLEIGVIQPKIFLMDKKGYLDNAGSFLTRTGFLQHWGFGRKDSKEFDYEREIFSAKGACMLIRRAVIEKIGLFDSNFGSYFEESDFCYRVWFSGWKVIYYPKTYIFHKVGWTSKKMDQIFVNLHSTKNRIFSLFKNLETYNLFLIFLPHVFLVFLLGIYYLMRLQFGKSWMMTGAILWNIKNLRLLLESRNKIKRFRKFSDRDLFPRIMQDVSIFEMINHFKKVEDNFKRL